MKMKLIYSIFTILLFSSLALTNANYFNIFNEELTDETIGKEWNGTIWAVLVAGSNFYYNYRHQADICHAYQVLHRHGVHDKNIIVMMYDDIAYDEENPTPGIIVNRPNGPDVYKGVPKDYTGKDVTPQNFLKVLQGDRQLAKKGRKVVKSGPNDHVFVYFADHGAPGLIAFPSDELYAKDLNKVLLKLSNQKRFAKMVVYIEACESGSMFKGLLPANINIFATTAANATESSYGCYWDEKRQTYLGDLYSVNWLENSDKSVLNKETLQQQFKTVKKETNLSHVQEYGELSISKLHVSQFQGSKVALDENESPNDVDPLKDAVPSEDVPLMIAFNKYINSKNKQQRKLNFENYQEILKGRNYFNYVLHKILLNLNVSLDSVLGHKQSLYNHDCYINFVKKFDQHCFDLSTHPYALKYLYVFVNLCQDYENEELIQKWNKQIIEYCKNNIQGNTFNRII